MVNLAIAGKALRQLGLARLAENGIYRLGLRFGWWQVSRPVGSNYSIDLSAFPPVSDFPAGDYALSQAEEVIAGRVRLFGGKPRPLVLAPPGRLRPWLDYERGLADWGVSDVKEIWEPARFGWAVTLARAYRQTHQDRFPRAFWEQFEQFRVSNPAYLGPNWTSGQEAALRIITWAFILGAVRDSSETTPQRLAVLASAIAEHAARIPPTLIYARSQDNNHLLSEAAGLFTAGTMLVGDPSAKKWRAAGWDWFQRAIYRQVVTDGTYIQQSLNYHRLLLQLALWMDALARAQGISWPETSRQRLAAAVEWLLPRVDPLTGRAPNFGHNDGAYLFPFGDFSDQRPVVQAAALAFLNRRVLPAGPWDEFATWLGLQNLAAWDDTSQCHASQEDIHQDSGALILPSGADRVFLRSARFHRRPGQADQLHVDLWHGGEPVTLDPGTYRYSALPPWENALASALVHNTVTINGQEPMLRAGRFLWLDWDQADERVVRQDGISARRLGYRKLGVLHRRTVSRPHMSLWRVEDQLERVGSVSKVYRVTLHWLLQDWPWRLEGQKLILDSAYGSWELKVTCAADEPPVAEVTLIRAGDVVAGKGGELPIIYGWFSPAYGELQPALSLLVSMTVALPACFVTEFYCP